jgi:general transcription factor 3C polypeptide 3 (transcription factor C subunit 4)
VLNNPSVCRQVADALVEFDLHVTALRFYKPLQEIPEENTASLHIQMGKCFLTQKLEDEADRSFKEAIRLDDSDTDARELLAKLHEGRGEEKSAFDLINQVIERKRLQQPETDIPTTAQRKRGRKANQTKGPSNNHFRVPTRPRNKPTGISAQLTTQHLEAQYYAFKTELEGMRNGDAEATKTWTTAAQKLIDDFRNVTSFYPSSNRHLKFTGYGASERMAAQTPLNSDLSIMADRLSKS